MVFSNQMKLQFTTVVTWLQWRQNFHASGRGQGLKKSVKLRNCYRKWQANQFFCSCLKFEGDTRKSFGSTVDEVLTPKAPHSQELPRLTKQSYEGLSPVHSSISVSTLLPFLLQAPGMFGV